MTYLCETRHRRPSQPGPRISSTIASLVGSNKESGTAEIGYMRPKRARTRANAP
jgi:hypothetical protein